MSGTHDVRVTADVIPPARMSQHTETSGMLIVRSGLTAADALRVLKLTELIVNAVARPPRDGFGLQTLMGTVAGELRAAMRRQGAGAPTAPAPAWWSADHHDSDRSYHTYCASCYARIPDFLIRWSDHLRPPYISGGEPAVCEGCGAVAGGGQLT